MSNTYAVRMVLRAQDQASRPIRAVQKNIDALRRRMAVQMRLVGAHRVAEQARRMSASIGGAANSLRAWAAPKVALGLTAAAGGLLAMVNSVGRLGDGAAKMAARLGIGVERLQELHYVAERGGASTDDMNNALRGLSKNIGAAVNGVGAAGPVFEQLGIPLVDAAGNVRAVDAVMLDLADHMATMPEGAERVALAQKLMEESGTRIIPVLAQGSDEILRQQRRARELGLISQKAAKLSEVWADSTLDARMALTGMGAAITEKILPVLNPLIGAFSEWVAANREWVAAKAETAVQAFGARLKELPIQSIVDGVRAFGRGIVRVADFLGGWDRALVALVLLLKADLVAGLISATAQTVRLG
ncbi:MAG: hypothetical protein HQL35_16225, partial [Alphaproteobacteria bacterium]|nr:hypothetical protein [Alphaproteobacteria bacterium]